MSEYHKSLEEQNEELRVKLAEAERLLEVADKLPKLHWKHADEAFVADNGNIYEDGYYLYLGKVQIGYIYKDTNVWDGKLLGDIAFQNYAKLEEIQAWMIDAFSRDVL